MSDFCFVGKQPFRVGEEEGLNLAKLSWVWKLKRSDYYLTRIKVKKLSCPERSIMVFRNCPEATTTNQAKFMEKNIDKLPNRIVNSIRYFNVYNPKDTCFGIWKEKNLECPTFKNINKIEDVYEFYKELDKPFLLRINNETGGRYSILTMKKNDIEQAYKIVNEGLKKKLSKDKETRMVAVEFIESEDEYNTVYRVHLVGDKIYSYYAVTGKNWCTHWADLTLDNLEFFIEKNQWLQREISKFNQYFVTAFHSVGCELGAIDFIVNEQKNPILLEINPHFAGNASKQYPGDFKTQEYLFTHKDDLNQPLKNIFEWLDYSNYYKGYYLTLKEYISKNPNPPVLGSEL